VLFFPVYTETQPCRFVVSLRARTYIPASESCNSHGIISFADSNPLTSIESYRCKKRTGEAPPFPYSKSYHKPLTPAFATHPRKSPITPLLATDPNSLNSKPIDCHTYETPRGVADKLLTSNQRTTQQFLLGLVLLHSTDRLSEHWPHRYRVSPRPCYSWEDAME